MKRAGCVSQRLLCVARASSLSAQHHRRGGHRADPPDSQALPRVLRYAACEGRAQLARCVHQPLLRLHGDHATRQTQLASQRLGKASIQDQRPQSALGGGMTYLPIWIGLLYRAVVIDVWSRRVGGWSMVERMKADLVRSSLNMTLTSVSRKTSPSQRPRQPRRIQPLVARPSSLRCLWGDPKDG